MFIRSKTEFPSLSRTCKDQCSELTPPLKWAGGKRWLVPELEKLYQPQRKRRLVEPFVGGLAVALALQPKEALLGDINPHAINFYHWLQKGLKIALKMENSADCYYKLRQRFNELIKRGLSDSAEGAALFYYLNRSGYNGLCRFNSKGLFNVPFGRYQKINYLRDFSAYRATLRKWTFICSDFETLRIRKSDFIYADPPYDVEFTKYAKEDFCWEDQLRLAKWLAKHPGPVVASNQATARIIKLYRELGFLVATVSAPRMISCTGDRRPAQEMLALKNML